MAIVNSDTMRSSMSSEALGMLDVYAGAIRDLLHALAFEIAKQRNSRGSQREVFIEEEDVKEASNQIVAAIRSSNLPPCVMAEADELSERVKSSLPKE